MQPNVKWSVIKLILGCGNASVLIKLYFLCHAVRVLTYMASLVLSLSMIIPQTPSPLQDLLGISIDVNSAQQADTFQVPRCLDPLISTCICCI